MRIAQGWDRKSVLITGYAHARKGKGERLKASGT
jgi:hypothetical protein